MGARQIVGAAQQITLPLDISVDAIAFVERAQGEAAGARLRLPVRTGYYRKRNWCWMNNIASPVVWLPPSKTCA